MSFRKKHKKAQAQAKEEDEDVKVVHESTGKDKNKDQSASDQAAQQTTGQQSEQETGQSQGESEEEGDSSDDAEPVPDGTTAEILQWVGGDQDRARRALDKEQGDDRPRAGLTGELRKILGE